MKTSTTYQLENLVNNIANGAGDGTYRVSLNDFDELEFTTTGAENGYWVSSKLGGRAEAVQASNIELAYALILTALKVRENLHHQDDFHYLGVWTDTKTEMVYFDTTAHFNSKAVALTVALENDQLAYWDIENGEAIETPRSDYNQP